MKKTISERLEDARTTLEAMIGELADIACELPYGSNESEAIMAFRFRLASILKTGALPHLPEEEEACDEESDDEAA
jgi:hypothetical protein